MEVRKECMLKDVIFPTVREYGIRIKYAHPMIQFILTMMTLFFIFQRKYVKFQFIAHVNPAKSSRTAALFSYSRDGNYALTELYDLCENSAMP